MFVYLFACLFALFSVCRKLNSVMGPRSKKGITQSELVINDLRPLMPT